jgi:nucleoside recognition membrane protein YjiH
MSNTSNGNIKPTGAHTAKFLIVSLIGIALFMVPIFDGGSHGIALGGRNILLGGVIDWLNTVFGSLYFTQYSPDTMGGNFAAHYLLALIFISVSFIGSVIAWVAKPKFIMDNERLKEVFHCHIVYLISKLIGFIFIWLIFLSHFGVGGNVIFDAVIHSWTGDVIIGLVAGLITIFLVIVPFMPLITEFGLMEFIGVVIRKVVRALFTLPGRASVDLMASWFGSSAASIIITRGQHERGFYTGREAAVIAVNFSFVSLPFTFVVANTMGLGDYFLWFYLVMCLTCVLLGLLLPRIWPLRQLTDTYLDGVGKQITEDERPEGTGMFAFAVDTASRKAASATFGDVAKSAGRSYTNIFMDLIPIIMAWGTIGIIIAEKTDLFNWISWPIGQYMRLLQIEGAMEVSHLTIVGFIDMFLPALMIGDVPMFTIFVIGVLSIVQIIYMAETGVLIAKSKMPLGVGKLFIIFLMRTVIGLPIIVGLTHLLSLFPAFPF